MLSKTERDYLTGMYTPSYAHKRFLEHKIKKKIKEFYQFELPLIQNSTVSDFTNIVSGYTNTSINKLGETRSLGWAVTPRPNAYEWLFSFHENGSGTSSRDTRVFSTVLSKAIKALDWEDYKTWLFNNKSEINAKNTFKDSKKYHHYAFSDELASMKPSRKRQDILKGISNLTRYLDIKHDTEFHELWLKWLKKKEIKWRMNPRTDTYLLANQIKLEDVLENIRNLPEKYKIFATFVLISGLRTSEAIEAFNNHDKICREGIMELFWDRGTKKANAVYCHPLLHEKMKYSTSASRVTKNLHSKLLGCEVRYLRKLNYTVNATKIDPLLAEFMQGRRGNVSQRHYYLPLLGQNQKKWNRVWTNTVQKVLMKK